MAKKPGARHLRNRFVTNLGRLMRERSYTPRETAKRAGIEDVKRFYRWASAGISRATHEHDADLEKLRQLFGLPSIGYFWAEDKPLTLANRLVEAGEIEWEYGVAYKLLVALRAKGRHDSRQICDGIDQLFLDATNESNPDEILSPSTGEQFATYLQINYPQAYAGLHRKWHGDRHELVAAIEDELRAGRSRANTLEVLIEVGLMADKAEG